MWHPEASELRASIAKPMILHFEGREVLKGLGPKIHLAAAVWELNLLLLYVAVVNPPMYDRIYEHPTRG